MKLSKYSFGCLVLFVISTLSLFASGHAHNVKKAVVSVIAFDQVIRLANLNYHNMRNEVLVVRIEKGSEKRPKSAYLLVLYQAWMEEPNLPEEMLEGAKGWQLELIREPSCDGTIKQIKELNRSRMGAAQNLNVQRWRFVAAAEEFKEDAQLPCYKLKPGKWKQMKSNSR